MKTWLTKFGISNSLDAAPEQPRASSRDTETIQRFETTIHSLDRRLKSELPSPTLPPGLHHSVMRAVSNATLNRAQRFAAERVWAGVLRWIPASALALLVIGGIWWALSRPEPGSQPLKVAGDALEQSYQLARQVPVTALAPLSKEMESLNRDFREAVEFLVASVP